MQPDNVTIAIVEERLNLPAVDWAGKCYDIASALVHEDIIYGRAVYGRFVGDVHPDSFFGKRRQHPFVQHGWVSLPDGRILDPTRWSFEACEPYIWLGENDGSYDEGGNQFRIETMSPWPEAEPDDKQLSFKLSANVIRALEKFGADITDEEIDPIDYDLMNVEMTPKQVFWVANLPRQYFGSDQNARDVYIQIIEHQLEGFIPIDNKISVLGD